MYRDNNFSCDRFFFIFSIQSDTGRNRQNEKKCITSKNISIQIFTDFDRSQRDLLIAVKLIDFGLLLWPQKNYESFIQLGGGEGDEYMKTLDRSFGH